MSLIDYDLFGTKTDKVARAVEALRAFEPPEEGYFLAFSGGKDSTVLKALCDMAGVKFDAHYSATTVDPPELVRYIKREHPDVEIVKSRESMRQLIIRHKTPPTRLIRYCCAELKECNGPNRITLTGVRASESIRRKKQAGEIKILNKKDQIALNFDNRENVKIVESCMRTHKVLVNPIIDWTDEDVWEFIRGHGIKYCELYDEGFRRLGCIGCPMAATKQRIKEFERWPAYRKLYVHAFDDMLIRRREAGLNTNRDGWTDGEGVFGWWMRDNIPWRDLEQISLEDI